MQDVENILGHPDETELIDPETGMSADWHYRLLKLHVGFFDDPTDVRRHGLQVASFLIGSQSATLWGIRVVGLGKLEILRLFDEHGYLGFTVRADHPVVRGYETLRLDKSHITLDFHNGILRRMLWGLVHDNERTA